MSEIIPTRGAARALAEERSLVETGFEFLDEKRMLLAATLLKELKAWQDLRDEYTAQSADALEVLKSGVARHGLEGLQLYPVGSGDVSAFDLSTSNFIGIHLLETPELEWQPPAPMPAVDASVQAANCGKTFAELLPIAAKLAARAANIQNLVKEYRNTERRARALENVILPETIANLNKITEYLDEADQEEAIRNRNAALAN